MRYILIGLLLTVQSILAQNYGRDNIPGELLGNADAVLRLDAMDIQLLAVDRMAYTATAVVTVLNAKGDRYANASLYYDRDKKIKKLEAIIYDGSGNQIAELKRKDFKDVAAVDGFSLYVDDRLLYHDYVPVQYPYTMAFTYQVESSDTGALPSWHFVPGFGLSVEDSRYTISHPPELQPRVKESNLEGFPVERRQESGLLRYIATGIPAFVQEDLAPSPGKYFPRLSVRLPSFHYKGHNGKVENWRDMGLWVQKELLEGRDRLGESTVTTVRALVSGVEDDLEKAKIVYRFVQDNTRYVSVQMGIGGLQPIPAMEVARDRYGDCKGLTNYTLALLKAVGVESRYAVVEAGRAKIDLEADFPTLAQGNHVILAIPHKGEYHWLDCTSQYLPFGYIGDFTDDRKVFVVTPQGGEIVGTTAYLDGENVQRVRASLSVGSDRSIKGEVNFQTSGALYDGRFPLERQIDKDVKEFYTHYWDNIGGLVVQGYRFDNDRDQVIFTEALTLAAPNYLAKNGEAYLLAPNAFNNDLDLPLRYRDRKLPFEVQRGFLEDTQTTLDIPPDLRVAELPEKFEQETPYGSYSVETIDQGDGHLIYKRRFLLKAGEYPKEEYRDFRNFLRTVTQRDKDKIVLVQAP